MRRIRFTMVSSYARLCTSIDRNSKHFSDSGWDAGEECAHGFTCMGYFNLDTPYARSFFSSRTIEDFNEIGMNPFKQCTGALIFQGFRHHVHVNDLDVTRFLDAHVMFLFYAA